MTSTIRRFTLRAVFAALCVAPLGMNIAAHADSPTKIGFLVKMPEQAWFINEQKAATALGQKENFSVVNIGTPDGEKVLAAIDNLGAQGAQGFVICAPDVRLGPAIQARAKRYNMKFVTVDDQLVDSSGKPRELHIEKALQVTAFEGTRSGKILPLALHSPDANKQLLAACQFFATEHWECDRTTFVEGDPVEFQLLIFLRGKGKLHDAERGYPYGPGQAWFLPASLQVATLQPAAPTSLLRVTVPEPKLLERQLESQGFSHSAVSRVVVV